MSVPDDDLEIDEHIARVNDLTEKLERDISEGGYLPGTALPALISVVVLQCLGCCDPDEALRLFLADLLDQFRSVLLDTPNDEP